MKTLKKLLSAVLVLAMLCSVLVIPALAVEGDVAEVNGVGFASLAEAVNAANAGDTVKLLSDVTLTSYLGIPKKVTIDLNGNAINTADVPSAVYVYTNGDLTIDDTSDAKSGKIIGNKDVLYIRNGAKTTMNAGTVTSNGDFAVVVHDSTFIMNGGSVNTTTGTGIYIRGTDEKPADVVIDGGSVTAGKTAITGNGSNDMDNGSLTIRNGSVVSNGSEDAGIYWPANGKLTIEGGKISGATGVYVKSGSLEVTAGNIIGTGAKVDYAPDGDGAVSTGDALVVENVGGNYEAIESVSITGGNFISNNSAAVGSYTAGKGQEEKTGFITGGTFSEDVSAYVADGYIAKCIADGVYEVMTEEEAYVAQVGEEKYLDLQTAVDTAEAAGGTVTLIGDVVLDDAKITVEGTVTIDLNGHSITGLPKTAAAYEVIANKGNLTITGEGEIVCKHTLASSTSYAVNTIKNEGKLTVNGGTIKNSHVGSGSTQIGYAIDNNSTSYDVAVTVNGGEIVAEGSDYYDGIRLFCNSETKTNDVTVNGGTVYSIWMQNPSDGSERNTKNPYGSVTVTGGTISIAIWLEPSENFSASITGGIIGDVAETDTGKGEGRVLSGFITGGKFVAPVGENMRAEGYECPLVDGYYVVHKCDKDVVTDTATCTTEGTKTFSCSVCGKKIDEDVSKAKGHDWDDGEVTTEPTCEAKGVKTKTCKNDATHTMTEEIAATGHKWDEGKVTTEAACEAKGVKTYTCANDETHTKTEDIAATGHKWDEGKVTTEAACTAAGVKTYTCATDATHTMAEEIPALGHKFVDGVCANCKLSVVVESESADTVTKEEVKVEEVKEVTVVETTETKNAETSVKKETTTIVTEVVTNVTKAADLVEYGVVTEETAVNLVAVAAVVNGDKATVEEALEAGVITEEEVAEIEKAVAEGKPAVTATIVVNEVSEEVVDKSAADAIEKTAEEKISEDAVVACYLDVSVVLSAAGKELGTLDKLEEPITITVAVPEELKGENRVYKVVRNHNGVVEVLDTTLNADGTISFTTDCFSTYAIAYSEKEVINTPPTGDNSIIAVCAVLMIISGTAVCWFIGKKRKFN